MFVGCFYFIFISLKYNFVVFDYNKDIFLVLVIGLRLYLFFYGCLKWCNNWCFYFCLFLLFWKWIVDSFFWNCGFIFLYNFDIDWLIFWVYIFNLLLYLEKCVILLERYWFILFLVVYLCCLIKFFCSFWKFFVL